MITSRLQIRKVCTFRLRVPEPGPAAAGWWCRSAVSSLGTGEPQEHPDPPDGTRRAGAATDTIRKGADDSAT
jgi:hypothetical protein